MTSACDPSDGGEQPTAATAVQGLATRLAAHWGQHSHAGITAQIGEVFAAVWGEGSRAAVQPRREDVDDVADQAAAELITNCDDFLDRDAAADHTTAYGWSEHSEDRDEALTAALAGLIEEYLLWWLTERGPVVLADRAAQRD